jgi:hypothetical protein
VIQDFVFGTQFENKGKESAERRLKTLIASDKYCWSLPVAISVK